MEQSAEVRNFLASSLREIGLAFDQEQTDKVLLYLDQLLEWNKVTNLTSIEDPYEIISKHFIDSLTALRATDFPPHATVIDVGSGAGFPGLPLKIARSDLQLVLIEPVQKKCSFLSSIVGLLKLKEVFIFTGNLGQYTSRVDYLLGDILTVRALRFEEIESQAFRALNDHGKGLLYRTEKAKSDQNFEWFTVKSQSSFSLPGDQGSRVIIVLEKRVVH